VNKKPRKQGTHPSLIAETSITTANLLNLEKMQATRKQITNRGITNNIAKKITNRGFAKNKPHKQNISSKHSIYNICSKNINVFVKKNKQIFFKT
jgi:hypothetical protein